MKNMPNDYLVRLALAYLPLPLAIAAVVIAYKMNKDAEARRK